MAGQSSFTAELGESICEGLEDGESLLSVCRRLNLKESTVRKWTRLFPQPFGANYARAREDGDDIEFERLAELQAEEPPVVDGKVDQGWVTWQKNRVDTAKWMLARKRPKIYGDKLVHQGDADKPIELVVRHIGSRVIEGEK